MDRQGLIQLGALAACVASGTLVGCGLVDDGAVDGAAPAGEPRVVMMRLTADYSSLEVLVCRTGGEPVSLGVAAAEVVWPGVVVSPGGRFVAVERAEGSVIVNLSTLAEVPLPGEATSLWRARWSPDGDRLAYFAGDVPRLVSSDGALVVALDGDLPPPAAAGESEFQGIEWSADGQQVAFVTRRLGILASRDGGAPRVFSRKMIGPYETPWGVALSPDGTTLAGLQTEEPNGYTRTVVVFDIPTGATRELELDHYSLIGWSSDSSGVTVLDRDVHVWFVPADGGPPRDFGQFAVPSPSAPEVALVAPGLPVENLQDGSIRMLLPESEQVNGVLWEAGGDVLWYLTPSRSGYVRAEDGALLADFDGQMRGIAASDGWVALADPFVPPYPGDLMIWDLFDGTDSVARVPWDAGSESVLPRHRAQWLSDGRLAFLGGDGLHVVRRDGSNDQVICPSGYQIQLPQAQGDRIEAFF